MDLVVAHGEVGALDEEQAEIARQVGMLEIGLAERARREQADARVGALGKRGKAGAERLEEGRQALDVHAPVEFGEGARQCVPVFERIAGPGRRLRAVAEHPPAAVGPAADVGGIELEVAAARRLDAVKRAEELAAAGDHRRRQRAFGDQAAGPVDVGKHGLQKLGALRDAGSDLLPLALGDDEGDVRERPFALRRAHALGVIAPRAVGDAGIAEILVAIGEATLDLRTGELVQRFEEAHPVPARHAFFRGELVGDTGQRLVAGDHRLQAACAAVRSRCLA